MNHGLSCRDSARWPVVLIAVWIVFLWGMPPMDTCSADEHAPSALSDPSSAETAIDRARTFVSQGDFNAALETLTPYIHAPETYPTLYSDYLATLIWAGREQEATRLFERLPKAVPRRSYLLMHMAGAYRRSGDYTHAGELYRELLQVEPDNIAALEGLATVLMESGDPAGAVPALDAVAERGGNRYTIQLLKAQVLLRQGAYIKSLALYDSLLASRPERQLAIAKARDDLIAGLSPEARKRLLAALKTHAKPDDIVSMANYSLGLVLCRQYETAVAFIDQACLDSARLPDDRLYWLAWAYFRVGRPLEASHCFDTIIVRQSDHLPARIGSIYCLADQGEAARAESALAQLLPAHPDDAELNFAHAYVLEKQGRFWDAVQVYNGILARSPDNVTAQRLRLRALSDLGATSVAQQEATRLFPEDTALRDTLRQDCGVDHLYWQEPDQAVSSLTALRAGGDGQRYLFDYINALVRAGQYAEAIQAYEAAVANGKPIPGWVKQSVAEAYLAQRQPDRALQLYAELLAAAPGDYQYRLGKFYSLQGLRRWQAADELLAGMKAETPPTLIQNGKPQPNPRMYELALVEAWYLADQDRLDEAQTAFTRLHQQAPANMEARNGLAHVCLWRGWPRRALEAFEIMHNMDADHTASWPGYISALNQTGRKARARELADTVQAGPPVDRHIQEARGAMDVAQMKVWRTDAALQREDDDSRDARIRTELSIPYDLKTRWFSYLLWQHTEYGDTGAWRDDPDDIRRIGIGLDHTANDRWRFRPSLSAGLDDSVDVGAALRADYTPNDVWSFGLTGDTYSTDLSGRARAADIDAALIGAEALWRQSELRQAGIGLTHTFFSDDNLRQELTLGYQQDLWRHHDWRLRGYADFYTVRNSKGDETVYFNPEEALELSVTAMIEQTLKRFYQRSFVHRLYITLGSYQQRHYGSDWMGSLRYEQAHDFSDRHALQVGVEIGRNVYDGDGVYDLQMDLVYQYRF